MKTQRNFTYQAKPLSSIIGYPQCRERLFGFSSVYYQDVQIIYCNKAGMCIVFKGPIKRKYWLRIYIPHIQAHIIYTIQPYCRIYVLNRLFRSEIISYFSKRKSIHFLLVTHEADINVYIFYGLYRIYKLGYAMQSRTIPFKF